MSVVPSFWKDILYATLQTYPKREMYLTPNVPNDFILHTSLYQDKRNILQIAKDVSLRAKKQGKSNVDPRCEDKKEEWCSKASRTNNPIRLTSKVKRRPRSPLLTSLAFSILSARRMIEEYLVRHELLSYNVPKKLIRSQAPGEDPEKYLSNIFFTTQEEIVSICQVSIKYNRQVTEPTFSCTRSSFSVWLSSANK